MKSNSGGLKSYYFTIDGQMLASDMRQTSRTLPDQRK